MILAVETVILIFASSASAGRDAEQLASGPSHHVFLDLFSNCQTVAGAHRDRAGIAVIAVQEAIVHVIAALVGLWLSGTGNHNCIMVNTCRESLVHCRLANVVLVPPST
ncbi:hypothetical protein LIA77_02933 [Sarocladium implicatum]|nr:hypothetical protein LIA77_02933 [Sarocladium implicatum]